MVPGKKYAVFAVRERGQGTVWTRIGEAFAQPDDSVNVNLDALPIGGRIHIRETEHGTLTLPTSVKLPDASGFKVKAGPSVDEVHPDKLSPIGKLVKAVRFVKHAHTHHDDTSSRGDRSSYTVSEQTFNELMEALEGVEQGAVGLNLKGGSAQ